MTFRSIGNISSQLMPDPPVQETCVIGYGLEVRKGANGPEVNSNRCHVTVQDPDGEQWHCRAMERGTTLHGPGWRVVWGEGMPEVEP